MLGQIFGALALLKEIIEGLKSLYAYVEKAKEDQWFKDWQETKVLLKNAKTSEERRAVAGRISNILNGF